MEAVVHAWTLVNQKYFFKRKMRTLWYTPEAIGTYAQSGNEEKESLTDLAANRAYLVLSDSWCGW